jgi:hypothetical protein
MTHQRYGEEQGETTMETMAAEIAVALRKQGITDDDFVCFDVTAMRADGQLVASHAHGNHPEDRLPAEPGQLACPFDLWTEDHPDEVPSPA